MKIRIKHLEKGGWGIKNGGREIPFQCHGTHLAPVTTPGSPG